MAFPMIAAAGAGTMTAGAGAGMAAMAPAAAALGPVGWAFLAAGAVSTVFSMSASRKAAEYERYQLKLAEQQAQIDARNTLDDLGRELRYTTGMALASLGHGGAGIGESFLAIRQDELNLYSRDVRNARLSSGSTRATISAAASASRARQDNQQIVGYLSLISQGLSGYDKYTRLKAGP